MAASDHQLHGVCDEVQDPGETTPTICNENATSIFGGDVPMSDTIENSRANEDIEEDPPPIVHVRGSNTVNEDMQSPPIEASSQQQVTDPLGIAPNTPPSLGNSILMQKKSKRSPASCNDSEPVLQSTCCDTLSSETAKTTPTPTTAQTEENGSDSEMAHAAATGAKSETVQEKTSDSEMHDTAEPPCPPNTPNAKHTMDCEDAVTNIMAPNVTQDPPQDDIDMSIDMPGSFSQEEEGENAVTAIGEGIDTFEAAPQTSEEHLDPSVGETTPTPQPRSRGEKEGVANDNSLFVPPASAEFVDISEPSNTAIEQFVSTLVPPTTAKKSKSEKTSDSRQSISKPPQLQVKRPGNLEMLSMLNNLAEAMDKKQQQEEDEIAESEPEPPASGNKHRDVSLDNKIRQLKTDRDILSNRLSKMREAKPSTSVDQIQHSMSCQRLQNQLNRMEKDLEIMGVSNDAVPEGQVGKPNSMARVTRNNVEALTQHDSDRETSLLANERRDRSSRKRPRKQPQKSLEDASSSGDATLQEQDIEDNVPSRGKANKGKKGGGKKGKATAASSAAPSSKGSKPKRKRQKLADVSLLGDGKLEESGVFEAAAQNHLKRDLPTINETHKTKILSQLLASVPKEFREEAKDDQLRLQKAVSVLKPSGCTGNGTGRWTLNNLTTTLDHHQAIGVAWMKEQELRTEAPRGGILADSMGLGKTVQSIALMLSNPMEKTDPGTTLIVLTKTLVSQWEDEIAKFVEPDANWSVVCIRTRKDLENLSCFAEHTVVITTYSQIAMSYPQNNPPAVLDGDKNAQESWWRDQIQLKKGPFHRHKFYRIILDEAHKIKNAQSHTSQACCALEANHRWCLGGTPITNRVGELYPFFKWLQVKHTGTPQVFAQNFCRGSNKHNQRLQAYLSGFMLRRRHADTLFDAPILKLPEFKEEFIYVDFNIVESKIYHMIEERFAKSVNNWVSKGEVKTHYGTVLSMLTYLRELTTHCLLAADQLAACILPQDETDLQARIAEEDGFSDTNVQLLFHRFVALLRDGRADLTKKAGLLDSESLNGEADEQTTCQSCLETAQIPYVTSCGHIYCKFCGKELLADRTLTHGKIVGKCVKCAANFNSFLPLPPERDVHRRFTAKEKCDMFFKGSKLLQSAKLNAAKTRIAQWVQEDPTQKIIIFTQWIPIIDVLDRMCSANNWTSVKLQGSMSSSAREDAIEDFQSDEGDIKILISGLKVGGIGLNLTRASRVINLDLWWNAALEEQAFCRVYRMGQTRPTSYVRFVVKGTIDHKLLAMQKKKKLAIGGIMGDSGSGNARPSMEELIELFRPATKEETDGFRYVEEDLETDSDSDSDE